MDKYAKKFIKNNNNNNNSNNNYAETKKSNSIEKRISRTSRIEKFDSENFVDVLKTDLPQSLGVSIESVFDLPDFSDSEDNFELPITPKFFELPESPIVEVESPNFYYFPTNKMPSFLQKYCSCCPCVGKPEPDSEPSSENSRGIPKEPTQRVRAFTESSFKNPAYISDDMKKGTVLVGGKERMS